MGGHPDHDGSVTVLCTKFDQVSAYALTNNVKKLTQ